MPNVIYETGKRTQAAMERESSGLALSYGAVNAMLKKLNTNEVIALIAIMRHTIEVDPTIKRVWETCPTLKKLEGS